MRIERAVPADVPAVEALLAEAGLPIEGAREALELGVVGRDGQRVVAAAAVERYGRAGLLRSVVVAASERGAGVGRDVVAAAEAVALAAGIDELYLLTETAVAWFPRLGYRPVDRSAAAALVGASVEFTTVCRDTGIAMAKHLDRPAVA
jgi:N-acetylglutamate synthase-like GNAT family acetyltransferase